MSFTTKNEVLAHIHRIFGEKIEIVEATFPLRVQPIPEDMEGASPKDPGNCVFVHSVKRQFGSQMVIFWKNICYGDMLDEDGVRRVFRFIVTKQATKMLAAFDQGKPFPVGTAISLKPPKPAQTLKANRRRTQRKKAETKTYVDRRKRFTGIMSKQAQAAKDADERLKKAKLMSKVKQDTANIAGIKRRKEAADAALKATQDKIAAMDKSRRKRAPKKFDLSTRNGAAGNYNFTMPPSPGNYRLPESYKPPTTRESA